MSNYEDSMETEEEMAAIYPEPAIVLTDAQMEALLFAEKFLRQKGDYMKTAEMMKRRASEIRKVLARAGAEQEKEA
jgi:hypothetical protein